MFKFVSIHHYPQQYLLWNHIINFEHKYHYPFRSWLHLEKVVLKRISGITKWTEESYNLIGPTNNSFAVFCCCQVKVSKLLGNHKRFKWWWFSATQNFVYYFTPSMSVFCDNSLKTVNIIANFMLKWISRVHAICIIKKSLQCSIQFLNSKDFLSIFCKENILFLDDSVCHDTVILCMYTPCIVFSLLHRGVV